MLWGKLNMNPLRRSGLLVLVALALAVGVLAQDKTIPAPNALVSQARPPASGDLAETAVFTSGGFDQV